MKAIQPCALLLLVGPDWHVEAASANVAMLGDVKPTAKSLLAHFGGFGEVMSADPDALSEAGLGLAGIAAITLCAVLMLPATGAPRVSAPAVSPPRSHPAAD